MKLRRSDPAAFLNFLEATVERTEAKAQPRSRPYILGIETSSLCGLRCPFCPTGLENEYRRQGNPKRFRTRTLIDPRMFRSIIDELRDVLFFVQLHNWGEPLLHPELPDLVRIASDAGIFTEIHSHLSLRLPDDRWRRLMASGVGRICASIDGCSQASYGTYRRGGDVELAISNLARLAGLRRRLGVDVELVWNFLVFAFNEHELEDAYAASRRLGVGFEARTAAIDADAHPEWVPRTAAHEWSPPRDASTAGDRPADRDGDPPSAGAPPPGSCAWHYGYSVVGADGRVSPCCAVWGQEQDFGCLDERTPRFSDVWTNERFRRARRADIAAPTAGRGDRELICESCPFGAGVRNLYAPLEIHIREAFRRAHGGSGCALEPAFDALDRSPEDLVRFFADHGDELRRAVE